MAELPEGFVLDKKKQNHLAHCQKDLL